MWYPDCPQDCQTSSQPLATHRQANLMLSTSFWSCPEGRVVGHGEKGSHCRFLPLGIEVRKYIAAILQALGSWEPHITQNTHNSREILPKDGESFWLMPKSKQLAGMIWLVNSSHSQWTLIWWYTRATISQKWDNLRIKNTGDYIKSH